MVCASTKQDDTLVFSFEMAHLHLLQLSSPLICVFEVAALVAAAFFNSPEFGTCFVCYFDRTNVVLPPDQE